jgi:hypothetical protein
MTDTPETEPQDGSDAVSHSTRRMSLQELKEKSPAELVELAESLDIENASALRKQGMMFAILKALADEGAEISGGGTLEVLQDGFGFLRAPESNYLPGRTTSMSRPARSAASACAPAIRWKARSGRRARMSGISRLLKVSRSISRSRKIPSTRFISTI